jgi:cysteine desulfurase
MIYLDYNATTPLSDASREAMLPYLDRLFGNPSSVHAAGREARAAIDNARDKLAGLLHVKPHELIFTGGGTESCNLAVLGLARRPSSSGGHVISNKAEHHAVLNALEYLEKHEGFEVTWLNVSRDGILDIDQLASAIRPETRLVSIMTANNETGVIQPMREISNICRARGILLHSDMVQSFGKIDTDLSLVDAASFAAHKFYGPKGVGFLFVRGLSIQPIMFGGAHENERRSEKCCRTGNCAPQNGHARLETEQQSEVQLRDELWTWNCAKRIRRKTECRKRAAAGKHTGREPARNRFRNAAHRAGFGRRLRLQWLGLHGGIGRCVTRFARHGSADGARAFRSSILTR